MISPLRAALFATLMLGCRREPEQEQVGRTTITGAQVETRKQNDDAVLQIVEARCAREVACNTVGDGHPWQNREGCVSQMRTRLESELKPASCPNGIDQNTLGLCLDAIRNESCGNPMETLARASACANAKLCLSAREPQ